MIRLRGWRNFRRVRLTGKSWSHPLTVLVAGSNQLAHTRVGFVASKSVGGAVQRNRAKRRLRAELHALRTQIAPGWDLVLIARRPILECSAAALCTAMNELLSRAGLLRTEQ